VIADGFRQVQDTICQFLKNATGENYHQDEWKYQDYKPNGSGGGITRVWESDILEKGGVNFSAIHGTNLPASAVPNFKGPFPHFFATGVSLVIHPRNPHIPTVHLNIRYFEAENERKEKIWWFGGGIDLTPYYPTKSQIKQFHTKLKNVCEKHNQPYLKYKEECDAYFFLKHRGEARGVGGIFFDRLNDRPKEELFAFVKELGMAFVEIYKPMVERGKEMVVSEEERDFQLYRRSRYVEFNLLWDRGTKFGINSGGRTESYLMSMPRLVKWMYNWEPEEGTKEDELTSFFLKPQDWVDMEEE